MLVNKKITIRKWTEQSSSNKKYNQRKTKKR